jgi:hypothetical protein
VVRHFVQMVSKLFQGMVGFITGGFISISCRSLLTRTRELAGDCHDSRIVLCLHIVRGEEQEERCQGVYVKVGQTQSNQAEIEERLEFAVRVECPVYPFPFIPTPTLPVPLLLSLSLLPLISPSSLLFRLPNPTHHVRTRFLVTQLCRPYRVSKAPSHTRRRGESSPRGMRFVDFF